MERDLKLSLSALDEFIEDNINLEQIGVGQYSHLSQYDILQMITFASYGISASTYKLQDCPIEITENNVNLWLDFYLWPSNIDLVYELETSLGELSESEKVSIPKEVDIIFENSTIVKLPWLIEDYEIIWQTPNINSMGRIITTQEVRVKGVNLVVDTPIFGVARLKCNAIGYKYTNNITVEKKIDMQVTDIDSVITAKWGEDQTAILQLEIPGCATAYLERCPTGDRFINQDCKERSKVYIWYSTCDGETLHIEQTDPCDD